jgi:hypothetical protein
LVGEVVILVEEVVDTLDGVVGVVISTYVCLANFLAPGLRDLFDANNNAVDYLYRALCQSEFDQVQTEDLACRIWLELKNAHAGNADVQARLYATYWREYENFTHLAGSSGSRWL